MTALLAIALGLAAVVYTAWPGLVRGGPALPLKEAADFDPPLESQLALLRAWSVAAGELPAAATDEPASVDRTSSEVKTSE